MTDGASEELCVLILQYNSADITLNLLESIVRHEGDNLSRYRVIVMDNASADPKENEMTRRFPFIEFVGFDENLGFAKAHNKIWPRITEKWVLLLNNDCLLLNDAINITLNKAMELDTDFATCALFNKDMSPQINFHLSPLPTSTWKFFTHLLGLQGIVARRLTVKKEIAELDYASGTFLIIRREAFVEAGMFDEDHFMYGEDVDLMFRLGKKGARGYRIAEGKVVHLNQGSSKRLWNDNAIHKIKMRETERVMLRHMPSWQVRLWLARISAQRAVAKVAYKLINMTRRGAV